MLTVLSPAKSLDFVTATPAAVGKIATQPQFVAQAKQLNQLLRQLDVPQLANLMSISDKLAVLNVARNHEWSPEFTLDNSKPAILAFDGDVYDGLSARSMGEDDLSWMQNHLCILSGLYGVLRPLDFMQPYRLEMGTRLANKKGRDLYAFWGSQIADYLQSRKPSVIVNLASQEYFKSVDQSALKAPVLDCVFEEWRGTTYKIVSLYAKRARGLMTRFIVTERLENPEQLQAFDTEGYAFDAEFSTPSRYVFRRGRT